jgi:predicted metal-dependent hydrolase
MKWHWRDWQRAAKKDLLPSPWNFLVAVPLRYMRPQHHPGPEADTQAALDYLAYSPAARDARERARAHEKAVAEQAAHT